MSRLAAGGFATLIGGAVGLVVVLVLVRVAVGYNRLVRGRNQVSAAWAQIDVQLKRRHDLIPTLVETVTGYAGHERTTLADVVDARGGAVAAAGAEPAGRAGAEEALTQSLGRLFAIAETYPALKANQNFGALQAELATTEDGISYARQFYNSTAQSYTNATQTFPANLVARLAGFGPRAYFEVTVSERAPVRVRF